MLLQLQHITKTFPGVTALSDVSLDFKAGEVHAICGENGAGKSTLMNIITGNLYPDPGGRILINDQSVSFSSYKDAKEKKIAMVHQERSLVGTMSIAENIFFNSHPVSKAGFIDYKMLRTKTAAMLATLQLDNLSPDTLVKNLSPVQAQMIEIAKALVIEPRILILDEPTASITEKETAILYHVIRQLKTSGTAIIYISHRLKEIFEIADTVTVFKDGKWQNTLSMGDVTTGKLIAMMVGREVLQLRHTDHTRDHKAVELQNIIGERFNDITFHINKGEIVTLAGLTGAGRTEIAKTIFGALPLSGGTIKLLGKEVRFIHTSQAVANGIAYVPEDRKQQSIFSEMNVMENIMASKFSGSGFQRFVPEREAIFTAEKYKTELRIAVPSVKKRMGQLSGGNQQKTVLARWLNMKPVLFIADEPTHGVDVGAKFEIYQLLQQLASEGTAILLISSDMPEVLALSNRIVLIAAGRKVGELTSAEASEEKIVSLISGFAD